MQDFVAAVPIAHRPSSCFMYRQHQDQLLYPISQWVSDSPKGPKMCARAPEDKALICFSLFQCLRSLCLSTEATGAGASTSNQDSAIWDRKAQARGVTQVQLWKCSTGYGRRACHGTWASEFRSIPLPFTPLRFGIALCRHAGDALVVLVAARTMLSWSLPWLKFIWVRELKRFMAMIAMSQSSLPYVLECVICRVSDPSFLQVFYQLLRISMWIDWPHNRPRRQS